ncbi:sigma-70 family RNA polymerase sigma factor [Dietzia natronolimnaea]|uniref:sigma-70 family RNA polymerase sigma factor n=1 Tax=Dietzia natronolimnaea TaxID=161920 RepID=UPI003D100F9F
MDLTGEFERERPRLTRIAARVLGDPAEAEDAVQQAWLRLARTDAAAVDNLQGWLTTVVTRVCLDRLKAAVPVPVPEYEPDRPGADPDPAEEVALAESVGSALHLVLDRLSPAERVALVLHDSFAVDFATIAGILDCTPAAARKHASRARSKVAAPPGGQGTADWDVVDAFLAAARDGEFSRLLGLLAPDVVVAGDPVAVGLGTPARIEGRDAVAEFFNGAAAAALPVFVHGRPGAAWFDRGVARVAFDFRVSGGLVTRIDFRAQPEALETINRRRGGDLR